MARDFQAVLMQAEVSQGTVAEEEERVPQEETQQVDLLVSVLPEPEALELQIRSPVLRYSTAAAVVEADGLLTEAREVQAAAEKAANLTHRQRQQYQVPRIPEGAEAAVPMEAHPLLVVLAVRVW